MAKGRKPDFVYRSGRVELSLWIEKGERDGRPYERHRFGVTKSEHYDGSWHESTVYFYPQDIGNMQALFGVYQVNHMVTFPTGESG